MGNPMFTGGQALELLGWANRLTVEQYQSRRAWLAKLTDPEFDPVLLSASLTSPFKGAILDADSPDEGPVDVAKLCLVPILQGEEKVISTEEAVRRGQAGSGTNWSQRVMEAVWAARESIPESVWPVGQYALFTRTIWRGGRGRRYVWYVIRDEDGWHRNYLWFSRSVNADGRFPAFGK